MKDKFITRFDNNKEQQSLFVEYDEKGDFVFTILSRVNPNDSKQITLTHEQKVHLINALR